MYEKWLKAFHMVASHGGVGRAAKALNVGQPTISAHLKTLEDYFRVELFYRQGRRVELTEVGRSLHEITRSLYGHESEAVAFLRSAGRSEHGRLRAGAVGPFDVMEMVHAFHAKHRWVDLSVDVLPRRELVTRLRAFDLDVGVFADAPEEADFHSFVYDRHPVRIIVPALHRLARRKRIQINDLEGEPFVLRDPSSVTRRAFEQALQRAAVKVRPVIQTNSREAVREAVARGMGLGVISEREHAPHPNIHVLTVEDADMSTGAWVACLAARRGRPLIDTFMKLVQQNRPAG
ncbi:MAG: LysR family transcriptional regulator [Betaproteobacteria bacterium]|nr:LysR family transcriptional regulator [Betaproteobacteria bacterium]